MTAAAVLYEKRGHVAWIAFNRPEKLNALDAASMLGLSDAITEMEDDDDVRVAVITGNGRAFSTGGDLHNFRGLLGDGRYAEVVDGVEASGLTLARLAACSKPVIAAVNGVAIAGGLEVILCCDIVIAAEGAMIGDGHLRYGVLPGGGGTVRLVKKLPLNVAKWLLMTGSLMSAEELRHWGLVNEVVEPSALLDRVAEIAGALAELSSLALARVKDVADRAADEPVLGGLDREHAAFREYVTSDDFLEGVAAFSERRRPNFQGS